MDDIIILYMESSGFNGADRPSLEAMYVATHPCWEKLKYCQNPATLLQFVLGEIHGLIQ